MNYINHKTVRPGNIFQFINPLLPSKSPNFIITVESINISGNIIYRFLYGGSGVTGKIDIENVDPIPLTTDLFEHNLTDDFSNYNNFGDQKWYKYQVKNETDDIAIVVEFLNDKYLNIQVNNRRLQKYPLYLHDLQNIIMDLTKDNEELNIKF